MPVWARLSLVILVWISISLAFLSSTKPAWRAYSTSKLPSRCIILLGDINGVSSNQDAETEDSHQIVTNSLSWISKAIGEKVSLSGPLNVTNSVRSQESRILIITTNYLTRLNKALIRPGRVDKKVELKLANNKITAELFCLVFKPVQGDVSLAEVA